MNLIPKFIFNTKPVLAWEISNTYTKLNVPYDLMIHYSYEEDILKRLVEYQNLDILNKKEDYLFAVTEPFNGYDPAGYVHVFVNSVRDFSKENDLSIDEIKNVIKHYLIHESHHIRQFEYLKSKGGPKAVEMAMLAEKMNQYGQGDLEKDVERFMNTGEIGDLSFLDKYIPSKSDNNEKEKV